MKRIVLIASAVAGLSVLGLVWPTTDIVAPDWSVLITDQNGTPIDGASVAASSQQYTLESHDHTESAVTGVDGRVHFNGRTVRANALTRILGVIRNIGEQGAHSSFGTHTWIVAAKPGYGLPSQRDLFRQNFREGNAHGSATQSSHLVLEKCPEGYGGFGCALPDDPEKPMRPFEH